MSVIGKLNDRKLLRELMKIIGTWDLEKATAATVRRHLEENFGADLSAPDLSFVKERFDMFFEDGEYHENEGQCIRKRKRKEPEMYLVSPLLQAIVGKGREMARAKAVKKVVVYGRKKGLHDRWWISTDYKLRVLFRGRHSVNIFDISKLLSQYGHIQDVMLCKECKVRRRMWGTIETCQCDQSQAQEDVRSWDTLPHDILVKIIARSSCGPNWFLCPNSFWYSYTRSTCYATVSHSWKLAVLDIVFPPNGKLDLRVLDSDPWKTSHVMFCHYLRIALNCRPASAWTTIYFPHKAIFVDRPYRQNDDTAIIKDDILTLIAEKMPELRNLFLPTRQLNEDLFSKLAPNWKNLRKVHVHISAHNFAVLQSNCKCLCELSLYGSMNENLASMLANFFPNLKSLKIRGCTMSNSVLRIILDGHKNLELLDSKKYFYCFADTHS